MALGILMIGITSSLSLMVVTLAQSRLNQHAVVVANLAREGIEVVRFIRDAKEGLTLPPGNGFDQVFPQVIGDSDTIVVDGFSSEVSQKTVPLVVSTITDCQNCDLFLDQDRYVTSATASALPTPYERLIRLTRVSASEGKVESIVYWRDRKRDHTFVLEDHLFDWR